MYFASSTRCLQYLQVLWSEGDTGLVYLPVSMTNEWALILILVNLFLKVLGIS